MYYLLFYSPSITTSIKILKCKCFLSLLTYPQFYSLLKVSFIIIIHFCTALYFFTLQFPSLVMLKSFLFLRHEMILFIYIQFVTKLTFSLILFILIQITNVFVHFPLHFVLICCLYSHYFVTLYQFFIANSPLFCSFSLTESFSMS